MTFPNVDILYYYRSSLLFVFKICCVCLTERRNRREHLSRTASFSKTPVTAEAGPDQRSHMGVRGSEYLGHPALSLQVSQMEQQGLSLLPSDGMLLSSVLV